MADLHPYCINPQWKTLEPSVINTFEFNYMNKIGEQLTSNFSIFYNNIEKLIPRLDIFDPITGELNIESTNAGKIQSVGTELRFLIRPNEHFMIDLSGMYQKSEDKTPGMEQIEPAYSPKWLAYGKFFYTFNKKITFSSNMRFVSAMESYYDNTFVNSINPAEGKVGRIGVGSDAYFVCDLHVRFDKVWKNMYLDFKINNVLNTKIRYPTTTANAWIDKGALGERRSFYITLGFKFE